MKFESYDFGRHVFNSLDVSLKQINYSLQYNNKALKNQKLFFSKNSIEKYFLNRVVKSGVHGLNILDVKDLSFSGYDEDGAKGRGYDGVLTTLSNIPLFSVVADCPQIMMAGKKTVGIVHASRETLDNKIIFKFVDVFSKSENLKDVYVGFSPYIFRDNFSHDFLKLKRKDIFLKYAKIEKEIFYLDLKKVIVGDLVNTGINPDNIFDKRLNTFDMSSLSLRDGGFQISYREHLSNPIKRGSGGLCIMLKNHNGL